MCTVKFTVSTNPGGKPGKLYKQVRGTRYINDSLAAKYGNKNTQATSRIIMWKQKKGEVSLIHSIAFLIVHKQTEQKSKSKTLPLQWSRKRRIQTFPKKESLTRNEPVRHLSRLVQENMGYPFSLFTDRCPRSKKKNDRKRRAERKRFRRSETVR